MTYLELQNAVLERFEEADRANAKLWINLFGSVLYGLEQWSFRYATDDVTTAVGSIDVSSEAADLGHVLGIWNDDGDELMPMNVREFYREFQPAVAQVSNGRPSGFTVHGGAIKVGPPADEVATYKSLYLRRWTDLADDTDDPLTVNAFPASLHWLLVSGAKATGQSAVQDPTAALTETPVARGLEAMRREYLTDVEPVGAQWRAWR